MPNPNQLNTSNEAAGATQWDNLGQNQESSKAARINFDDLSYEEIKQLQPENLSDEELSVLAATLKKRISEYEKIIAAGREKETAQVTEAEATSAPTEDAETDTTEAKETTTNEEVAEIDPNNANISGLDTIVADQEPTVSPIAETVPVAPVQTSEEVSATETSKETVTTDAETTSGTITAEELNQTRVKAKEKAKKGFSIKNFFNKKVLSVVLVAAVLIGGIIVGTNAIGKDSSNQSSDKNNDQSPTEQVQSAGEQHEQHGLKEGYGEYGMYDDADKANPLNFANASKVAEVCNNNPVEMAIYAASNQVETLADYYTGVPDQNRPDFLRGINTLDEMESRLQSASADDYDAALQQFSNLLRNQNTTVENFVANGDFHNAYMAKSSDEATTHDNVNLVHCITNENGTPCTKFTFHDDNGNETGSMIIKTGVMQTESGWISVDSDGTICLQKIDQDGSLYVGLTTISNNPNHSDQPNPPTPDPPNHSDQPNPPTPDPDPNPTPNPTPDPTPPEPTPPTPEPEPTPGHPAKNTEAEKKNDGPLADQQPLNEDKTPKTTIEQDKEPVKQAHEQVSSGDTAGAKEEKATQQKVDEAAKSASQESDSNKDNSTKERADMSKKGDY